MFSEGLYCYYYFILYLFYVNCVNIWYYNNLVIISQYFYTPLGNFTHMTRTSIKNRS